uniref:Monocarboxylate transporter n=1 Tax=Timema tahoe TaxID=61484 RepID=A0A7R9FJJ4_9NEOP|nr:unnamed protein product [Timema tahoe]
MDSTRESSALSPADGAGPQEEGILKTTNGYVINEMIGDTPEKRPLDQPIELSSRNSSKESLHVQFHEDTHGGSHDEEGEGKSKTAWIGGLFMAMPLLSGPVASYLTDRFGCRKVCIFGAFLAAFGFMISSVANSIELLIFTFGIVSGVGLALCYVAAVVIVAYYFDKRRSLATGLAVCGSGIGTFLFAPLSHYLLEEFGWRGTTLILAGLKDRKAKNRERRNKTRSQSLRTQTSSQTSSQNLPTYPSLDELKVLLQDGRVPPGVLPSDKQDGPVELSRFCSSVVNLPTYVRNGEKVPFEVLELLSNNQSLYHLLLQNYPGLMISSHSFSDSGRLHENATAGGKKQQPLEAPVKLIEKGAPSPLVVIPHPAVPSKPVVVTPSKKAKEPANQVTGEEALILLQQQPGSEKKMTTAHLRDIRMHRNSMTYRGAMLSIKRYRLRASSCPDIYRNSMITIAQEKNEWYTSLWDVLDVLSDMVDFSHFSDIQFVLFAISNFLLYSWYHVPYVFLTDKAIEMGMENDDASYLISYLGILNMVGEHTLPTLQLILFRCSVRFQIFLGWAGDQPWINAGVVYAASMAMCGFATMVVPLITSYAGLATVAGIFGFSIAGNYCLASIILVELISLDRFTNAYGLLLLVQGIANLVGPPLAGESSWLYDISGDYDMSFYLSGLFIVLCGALLIILPAMKWYRQFKQHRAKTVAKAKAKRSLGKMIYVKEDRAKGLLAAKNPV